VQARSLTAGCEPTFANKPRLLAANIGMEAAAASAPNGYTFLVCGESIAITPGAIARAKLITTLLRRMI
jgi:hypothetical protein